MGIPEALLFKAARVLLVGIAAALALVAVLDLPREAGGLTGDVAQALDRSGVENPVTAVLLNFRGYDTLLEVAVLTLAAVALFALSRRPDLRMVPGVTGASPVLRALVLVFVPLAVLTAVNQLWLGSHAPGGAFQAGAVAAAAIAILWLAGYRSLAGAPAPVLSWLLFAGFAVFVGAGAAMAAAGRTFLEYPPALAGTLIVLIEAAAAVSIGVALAVLFVGAAPQRTEEAVDGLPGRPEA